MARPGDRHIYYRLCGDGWELVLEARFRAFNEIRRVADRAVAAADGAAGPRLIEMRDTWAFLESGGDELLRAGPRQAGPTAGRGGHVLRAPSLHRPLRPWRGGGASGGC